jgi:hypothetical protein
LSDFAHKLAADATPAPDRRPILRDELTKHGGVLFIVNDAVGTSAYGFASNAAIRSDRPVKKGLEALAFIRLKKENGR